MDKFYMMENPMVPAKERPIYLMHTQQPPMIIRVYHEAVAYGGDPDMHETGFYQREGQDIETVSLTIEALLICEPELSPELRAKIKKTLKKAWHWYIAYMEWEDEQFDDMENGED